MRDYYDILGVRPDASPDEIKRAYKTLARRHHPDTNSGSTSAEEAFKELSGAYAVLSDPTARVLYDLYGSSGPGPGGSWEAVRSSTPAPAAIEPPTPALYLTPAEMSGGCIKVLPLPCAACGGHRGDIGKACVACGGRGWHPAAPGVRVEVPRGVSVGDILWGAIVARGDHDPVPFQVRLRRAVRAPAGARRQARAPRPGRGQGPLPRRRVDIFPGHSPAAARSAPAVARAKTAAALAAVRARLARFLAGIERRIGRSLRQLGGSGAYPLAEQLAATARALDRLGDRQIEALDAVERRLATDLNRLRQLVPRLAAPIPVLAALDDSGRILFAPASRQHEASALEARLPADERPVDSDRDLARIHDLALAIRDQLAAMGAGASGLADGVRHDFEQAAGIPARASVADAVRDAIAALLRPGADSSAVVAAPPLPERRVAHLALNLLAFALWGAAVIAAALSLAPALRSLPVLASAARAWAAALALPLAASLAGLLAKEALVSAGRSALTQRAVPWLGKRPVAILAVTLTLVLTLLAGSVGASHPTIQASVMFTALWDAGTVLAAALAGLQLDAAFAAACGCAFLFALVAAWVPLRIAHVAIAALQWVFSVGTPRSST